jgi:hypothetical protein
VFLSWEFKGTTKQITKQIVSKKVWKQLDQKPTQKNLPLVLFLVFGLWPSPPPRVGTISRKTSDSTDKSNGQNLLDIAVTNALELLRGQNFEN